MKRVACCGMLLALAASVQALPAYSRIYFGKYGYRASCTLCHTNGGGSSLTDYGRDFLRAGANTSAFTKLEAKDSDKDGFPNLFEIRGKSNAGDERSTPKFLGDWLGDADKVPVPQKELKKLFADAEAFSGLEGSLNATQVEKVAKSAGENLSDEDKVPTFYFALKGGKKYAVAQFIAVPTPKGPMSVAVALDIRASVTGVRILKNPGDKSVENDAFLNQFIGKRQSDSVSIGANLVAAPGAIEPSKEVAIGVRKAVAVMNAVFGK